jgi:hypothetical protein
VADVNVDFQELIPSEQLRDAFDSFLRSFLPVHNKFQQSMARGLRNGLTIGENMNARIVALGNYKVNGVTQPTLTSGVEYAIVNPFKPGRPVMFMPGYAEDANGNTLNIVSWGMNQRRSDGLLGLTVGLDLLHTQPYLEKYLASNFSVNNTTDTTVLWDTTGATRGSGISYSSGVFTVAEAGTYHIGGTIAWQGSVTYTSMEMRVRIISGAANGIANLGTAAYPAINAAMTDYCWLNFSAQIKLLAGATFDIRVYQANGAAAARVVRGTASNAILPSFVSVNRIYNDTAKTGRVVGVLWGG